jgi:hypothetical protein
MIIDMSGPSTSPNVFTFPDAIPFTDAPRDEPIGEVVQVSACGDVSSVTVCGSIDD